MNSKRFLNEGNCVSVARNPPLRFGALALGQQAGISSVYAFAQILASLGLQIPAKCCAQFLFGHF